MRGELLREIEQFLYREARLLDERRFGEWLDLFTDDVRYWMPVRSTRYPRRSKAIVVLDPDRHEEEELAKDGELGIFDESKETLCRRVARLDTGMAWAEDPPSRTRHLVSNVEVEPGDHEARSRSTPTSWCSGAAGRPSRTSTWGRAATRSATSREHGRSPAAPSSSTRTCSWRRT